MNAIEIKCQGCDHVLLVTPEYGDSWWYCFECDRDLTGVER